MPKFKPSDYQMEHIDSASATNHDIVTAAINDRFTYNENSRQANQSSLKKTLTSKVLDSTAEPKSTMNLR